MTTTTTNGQKRPVGRPRILTDEKKDLVVRFLETGGSRKMAAHFVGCHYTTIVDETKRDEEFSARLNEAESKCYAKHLQKILSSDDWRSAAWFMERKFQNEFAKLEKHAFTDSSGHDLTPEQRKAAVDAILEERFGTIPTNGKTHD